MSKDDLLKSAVRKRQQVTGEPYLQARTALLKEALTAPGTAHWAAVRYLERNPDEARKLRESLPITGPAGFENDMMTEKD